MVKYLGFIYVYLIRIDKSNFEKILTAVHFCSSSGDDLSFYVGRRGKTILKGGSKN